MAHSVTLDNDGIAVRFESLDLICKSELRTLPAGRAILRLYRDPKTKDYILHTQVKNIGRVMYYHDLTVALASLRPKADFANEVVRFVEEGLAIHKKGGKTTNRKKGKKHAS